MIPFNVPPFAPGAIDNLQRVISNQKYSGDGPFTKVCSQWIEQRTKTAKALLTTSGTHALEMASLMCDINEGDEVILPSYTFSSTANAFLGQGARLVFIDIRPDTMNIDEKIIEEAITPKTKIIVPVHYAGVSCEMDTILDIAKRHSLFVVEDAAQAAMAYYKNTPLGTLGDFGCYSFHETKNYSMGEGGALLLKDKATQLRAEIIREKGTDRSRFFRGEIDKYSWRDYGSSYLPSELNAAFLAAQLDVADDINKDRIQSWCKYNAMLNPLADIVEIDLPVVPPECTHNGHMFYIKCHDTEERQHLIRHLGQWGIKTVFHYVPLHSSIAGKKYGRFFGEDRFTTRDSERLLRLPLYYKLKEEDITFVCEKIYSFYGKKFE